MKLRVRFLQLPVMFDAERLAREVAAIPEDAPGVRIHRAIPATTP